MILAALAVIVSTGAIDPNATLEKVCQPGYTASIRPPASVTNVYKRKLCADRGGDIDSCMASNEGDHFEAMEIGGDPAWRKIDGKWILTHPENFWLEPWPEARKKDADETRLHRAVCKGQMTLEQAQDEIKKKWKIHD